MSPSPFSAVTQPSSEHPSPAVCPVPCATATASALSTSRNQSMEKATTQNTTTMNKTPNQARMEVFQTGIPLPIPNAELVKALQGKKDAGTTALASALPLPKICYDPTGKDYYIPEDHGGYIRVSEGSAIMTLMGTGYSPKCADDAFLSEVDEAMLTIRAKNNVEHVGSLAGYPVGMRTVTGLRVLVTKEAKLVAPKPGNWPLLRGILEKGFGVTQLPYLLAWLKMSLEMYAQCKFMPAPVPAICGPVDCGKSLLLAIVRKLFGGRMAFPYSYMTGQTPFNGDLFEAELLSVDDECEALDMRSRRNFAAKIKQVAVTSTHYHHAKNRQPVSLSPLWRLMICLNDTPRRLQVLPPLDSDVDDKLMLLKMEKHAMPLPTHTPALRAQFEAALEAELPAFADFLSTWSIPEELAAGRAGFKAYHHPALVGALKSTSPEQQFMEMIDETIFDGPNAHKRASWEGSAAKLQAGLVEGPCGHEARGLLRHSNTCGTLLGSIEDCDLGRVSQRKTRGKVVWTILPPPEDTGDGTGMEAAMQRLREKLNLGAKG